MPEKAVFIYTKPGGKGEYFMPSAIPYEWYLLSSHWMDVRQRAIDNSDGLCVRCGGKRRIQVHHKNYTNLGNEKDEDIEVLCGECHEDEHS